MPQSTDALVALPGSNWGSEGVRGIQPLVPLGLLSRINWISTLDPRGSHSATLTRQGAFAGGAENGVVVVAEGVIISFQVRVTFRPAASAASGPSQTRPVIPTTTAAIAKLRIFRVNFGVFDKKRHFT